MGNVEGGAVAGLAIELRDWCTHECVTLPSVLLALHDNDARRWEPRRLRHRLYTIRARLVRGARQTRLRYATHHPWAGLLACALTTLAVLDTS